ncbi:DUF3105 domain-containing protein [Actinoplanes sp. TBRC 11911]|uniref:DUF3105 domain-containing protein n=1 Tax=Actinoplanes sp. TBRC 11911 TaxID=2729386 RepID=UPI00145C804E|nr:DUF3105 domain-containing protein [Actinoplanes sp. TBRC 11911]NMO56050.1 DUF3105 domain-containing protein [Actinoplanes sp. TBRC 11911]
MSMSTPGPERNPSTVKAGRTSGQGKPPAGKKAGAQASRKPGQRPPTTGKGGKGRRTPVPIKPARNFAPWIVAGIVVLIAGGIVVAAVIGTVQGSKGWEDKMADIKGVVDYRAQKNPQIDSRNHKDGTLQYATTPPVGGDHNPLWQNCMGDIYDQPIANEHAVHSLEHGAVWVTYKPGLPADQINVLRQKVEGKEYMLMSPYTGLDKNVSLQVWGYQYKTDDVNDKNIDAFIKNGRLNASMEPGAACSNGNTTTGPVTAASTGGPGMTTGN